ncbi:uncharacterized protein LOC143862806 [Tasmannia lanceolata]|uniref:uncharacterized protein LOC143862806 n=1 Tax=Tasmannia lanceolata TaxID=3420 RepID=UPI004062E266
MCKEDLLLLSDRRGWLSSPIVNVYTDYLNLRDECLRKEQKGACICLTTHLAQLIITDRCENPEVCSRFVKRLENISVKDLRKVLIPINIDFVHWVLLLLDMGQCTFALYDSLVARMDPTGCNPLLITLFNGSKG